MLKPFFEIIGYAKLFKAYLGNRIYLIFCFSFLASMSEAFGIMMLLPLLESLGEQSQSLNIEESTSKINAILYQFFNFLGIANSTPSIIVLITIIFLLKGIITFVALSFNAYLIGKLLKELKGRLFNKYNQMNFSYYASKDTGYFINLINEQPTKALESFNQLTIFGGQLINTFVLMSIAFLLSWLFGLMALGVGVLLLILFMSLNSYVRSLSRITAKENGNLNKWLIQSLQGFKYLIATTQTSILKVNIIGSINLLAKNQIKTGIAAAFTQSVREPIAVIFIMLVVFIQLIIFNAKIEPLLVSIVLFYRALNSTLAVQSAFQGTFQHIGSMELVNAEFLAQEENQVRDGSKVIKEFKHLIDFNNVSFRYSEKSFELKNINLKIPSKKSIALVGESGSGKSTLVDLVTLMHVPHNGTIYIDGEDTLVINKNSWRQQIGYVSQETVIFDDSIGNNICMWNGDFNKDKELLNKIKDAARKANILDFIQTQKDGFNTVVGDRGVLLSGGQKQRLFLARELLREPSLLILDEATSALDSDSEKKIQESIDKLKGVATVIVIAHRLSTIKNVDLIYVIENGRLIESGTYESLIKNSNSKFKAMTDLQSLN